MVITLQDLINNIESYILNLELSSKLKNHHAFDMVISEIKNVLSNLDNNVKIVIPTNKRKQLDNSLIFGGLLSNGEKFNIVIKNNGVSSFYVQTIYEDGNYYSDRIKKYINGIKEINLKVSINTLSDNPLLYVDKYNSYAYLSSGSYWIHTLDSNHESKVYNKNGVMIEKEYKEMDTCFCGFGFNNSIRVSYENILTRILNNPMSTKIEQSEAKYNKMILLHRNKVDVAEFYYIANDKEYGAVIPVNIEQGIANINIKDETYFKGYIIPKQTNTSVKLKQRIMYR